MGQISTRNTPDSNHKTGFMIFATSRLIIRDYRDEDRAIIFAIAGNPLTRLYHMRVVSRADTDAFIDRQIETIRDIGCGYAVVERKADGAIVGDVGMRPMKGDMPFSDDVHFDIGWQLDPQYFGNGYASEAARGWLDYAFGELRLDGVVSYTAAANIPSINVMKRIGMRRDEARDFDHPRVAVGHPLRPQTVYSIFSSSRETSST